MKLVAVEVANIGPRAVDLKVVLNVQNPNDFEVGLNYLDYEVSSAGLAIGGGRFKEEFKVGPESDANLNLPFRLDPQSAIKIIEKYLTNPKKIKALVKATVNFITPIGEMERTFVQEKTIVKH